MVHDCVIVGGGISGLAATLTLQDAGAGSGRTRAVLVEAADRLGGCIATYRQSELLIEAGPDSFLSRKPAALRLCERLGLGADLIERRPEHRGAFISRGHDLHPLPEGMSGLVPLDPSTLAGSGLLSEAGKRRFAAEVDTPARTEDGSAAAMADESVGAFAARRFGAEARDYLIEPLLAGIFSGDVEQMSLQATFPQLRDAEREYGSVLKGLRQVPIARPPAAGSRARQYGPFLSLREGMGQLVDAASTHLSATQIRTATTARSLHRDGELWHLDLAGGDILVSHSVILATPAQVTRSLLVSAAPVVADGLAEIPAASTAIVSLAITTDASRFRYGWLVPAREHRAAVAVSVSSNKWPGRAPAATALFRVFLGRWPSDDPTPLGDAELIDLARHELATAGVAGAPSLVRVQRWHRAVPQYLLGHQTLLERCRAAIAALPGIGLAGSYLRGVGVPDCIASGEEAARTVIAYLETRSG